MDLTGISRDELDAVIDRLDVVRAAMEVLDRAGLGSVVDLDDFETVLRCGPLRAPEDDRRAVTVVPEEDTAEEGEPLASFDLPDGVGMDDLGPVVIEEAGPVFPPPIRDAALIEGQDAEAPPPVEKLGGEGEGLQRLALAEDAPLPAGGAASPAGDPAEPSSSDPAPVPAAQEPPAAAQGTAVAVEAPDLPAARTTPGGGQAGPAAPPAYGATWTAAEDDALVAGVIDLVRAGKTRNAAAVELAGKIGRSPEAARYRVSKALKPRIDAALARESFPPQSDAVSTMVPEVAAQRVAASAGPVQLVAPDHLQGEHRRIWSALDDLRPDPRFDAPADLDIFTAYDSGAGVQPLALDFGLDGRALVDRYRCITRCIQDPKGRTRPELRGKFAAVLKWRAEAQAKARAAA
jgi:hypothetical protein